MPLTEVFFLALALAVDAAIVCFSFGLVVRTGRWKIALTLALSTGLGQFIMPLIGYYITNGFLDYIRECDHWLVFGIFAVLGLKFIWDAVSRSDDEREEVTSISVRSVILVGLATSIDALVSGSILVLTGTPLWSAAALIAGVTFVLSLTGFFLTRFLHHLPSKWLEIFVGLVLIALGTRVLIEHLSAH